MKKRSYWYCGLTTSLDVLLYALTGGRFLWLEGRVGGGRFHNWLRRVSYRPKRFVEPTSETEIVELIRSSAKLRVFGAGHSFNSGVYSEDTLVSLDKYSGEVHTDRDGTEVTFRGGTRVRLASRILLEKGLAFEHLPSHDAQSIAGIISTDVHGTGRGPSFVSDQVVRLKLIDGSGQVHVCEPKDDLFKAAVGGIGAVGIISEVTVKAVPRFNLRQKVERARWSEVAVNLESLLNKNRHLSLYVFPFTDRCLINTWNPVSPTQKQSFLGPLREFVSIALDALLAAWLGNLLAYARLLPRLSTLVHGAKLGRNLVLESYQAFNRSIYHLHQELEFAVPFEQTVPVCEQFRTLFEDMYKAGERLPYTAFEVRFTPAGHESTLIGPGRARRSTWIDLLANDSHGFERYFARAEAELKRSGARLHLGKFNETFSEADLQRLHGERFERFLEMRSEYDPEDKFSNPFTRRMFGPTRAVSRAVPATATATATAALPAFEVREQVSSPPSEASIHPGR
jgi:FAD/FMN-containing dehydrogenase